MYNIHLGLLLRGKSDSLVNAFIVYTHTHEIPLAIFGVRQKVHRLYRLWPMKIYDEWLVCLQSA